MSYYVAIDGELGPQVATNAGWYEFCRWVREQSGIPELQRLADDGLSEDAPTLRRQLALVLADGAPTEDNRIVGEGLLAMIGAIPAGEVVMITDGS